MLTARIHQLAAGLGALAAMLAAPAVAAAPQMLVLAATGGPVALQCADGTCTAELPSMCLQPERKAPAAGQHYRLSGDTAAVELHGRDADGRNVSVRLPDEARIEAVRTHVAVRITLPADATAGPMRAVESVSVAQATALTPRAVAGDPNPLSDEELRRGAGADRALARSLIADDVQRETALRVSSRLINMLPAERQASEQALEKAWKTALAGVAGAPAADLELARFQYDFCRFEAGNTGATVRTCLQGQQDRAMEALYSAYEAAVKAGS